MAAMEDDFARLILLAPPAAGAVIEEAGLRLHHE